MDLAPLEARTRALIASDRVTAPTRRALLARMDATFAEPRALSPGQMRTLRAVAARLVPLDGLDLAARFDAMLADGPGDGWRYADLPPDQEVHAVALDRLAAAGFADLDAEAQDAVLTAVQAGDPPGQAWPFRADRWFEEVLAALVKLAYSHPLAQASIGYDGFADAHGQPPTA